jgi:hypothetical protein
MVHLLKEMRNNPAKMDANLKEIIAELRARQKEMMASDEAMEACLTSKELTSLEAEHEEVPKVEAAVETIRALKKQHGDQHLAVRHCGQPKKWRQSSGASWKKLAAACRGMTRRAILAQCKGHGHQGQGQNNVARRAPKGWTFGKKHRA